MVTLFTAAMAAELVALPHKVNVENRMDTCTNADVVRTYIVDSEAVEQPTLLLPRPT